MWHSRGQHTLRGKAEFVDLRASLRLASIRFGARPFESSLGAA